MLKREKFPIPQCVDIWETAGRGRMNNQESQLIIYTECRICEKYVQCVQKCAHGQKSLGNVEGTLRNWGMIRKYLIEASPCSYRKTLIFFSISKSDSHFSIKFSVEKENYWHIYVAFYMHDWLQYTQKSHFKCSKHMYKVTPNEQYLSSRFSLVLMNITTNLFYL